MLLVTIGFCCLILPGIYLSVCYLFAPLFIIDRKVSFWEGMEIARRQVHRKWFRVFWYLILSSVIAFSGVILLGFGLLFTMPMGLVGFLMIYENLLQEEIKFPALIQKTSGYPEVFAANLCVFPGLGTWLGGKIVTGIIQMIGASIGVLFLIYGMVEIIRYWDKLSEAASWFRMSRHGLINMGWGLIIMKIFWLWGLWSAWRYKQEELRK